MTQPIPRIWAFPSHLDWITGHYKAKPSDDAEPYIHASRAVLMADPEVRSIINQECAAAIEGLIKAMHFEGVNKMSAAVMQEVANELRARKP